MAGKININNGGTFEVVWGGVSCSDCTAKCYGCSTYCYDSCKSGCYNCSGYCNSCTGSCVRRFTTSSTNSMYLALYYQGSYVGWYRGTSTSIAGHNRGDGVYSNVDSISAITPSIGVLSHSMYDTYATAHDVAVYAFAGSPTYSYSTEYRDTGSTNTTQSKINISGSWKVPQQFKLNIGGSWKALQK